MRKKVRIDTVLVLVLLGIGAILTSYGAWLAYHPAGYIVGGLLCLAVVVQHVLSEGEGP